MCQRLLGMMETDMTTKEQLPRSHMIMTDIAFKPLKILFQKAENVNIVNTVTIRNLNKEIKRPL